MKGLERLRAVLSRRGVVVTSTTLLTILGAEARSAAARGVVAAATGPATAAATRVAAALVKRSLLGYALRRAAVCVLLTAGVSLGVGIAVKSSFAPQVPPNPALPAPAPRAARDPAPALGWFDRSVDVGGPARAGAASSPEMFTRSAAAAPTFTG